MPIYDLPNGRVIAHVECKDSALKQKLSELMLAYTKALRLQDEAALLLPPGTYLQVYGNGDCIIIRESHDTPVTQ